MKTGLYVFHRVVEGLLGNIDPGILGRPQRNALENSNGNIRIPLYRPVTPATLAILTGNNPLNHRLQFLANSGVTRLAVQFCQRDGGHSVSVHVLAVSLAAIDARILIDLL